jgi:hypothetical protein
MEIEFGTQINVASPIPSPFYSAPCMLMGADSILSTIDTIVLALPNFERTSYEDEDQDEDQDGGDRELKGGGGVEGGGDQNHGHIAEEGARLRAFGGRPLDSLDDLLHVRHAIMRPSAVGAATIEFEAWLRRRQHKGVLNPLETLNLWQYPADDMKAGASNLVRQGLVGSLV